MSPKGLLIIYFLYEVPAELIMQIINERIEGVSYAEIDIDTNDIIKVANKYFSQPYVYTLVSP